MTPDEQRIAIAEWCGWTDCHDSPARDFIVGYAPGKIDLGYTELPNYLNDLNAMHEAEKKLRQHEGFFITGKGSGTTNIWASYRNNLNRLLGGIWTSTVEAEIFHATAAQRVEALLRTIGRWKDEP